MSYQIEKKGDAEMTLTISVPWSDAEETYNKMTTDAAKNVSVKGFRDGKVPKDVAESKVDHQAILTETANVMIGKEFEAAAKEEKIVPIVQPHVHIKKLAAGNDIECTIEIAMKPEIEMPKKWRDAVKKANAEHAEKEVKISDEDIEKELKKLVESRAESIPVDRAAQNGDQATVDFTVMQDNVVIENGTSRDHALLLGKGVFIPGFEEKVVGMKVDEEKTFELDFPKDYHAKHLAGKPATFVVTLKKVEERKIPKLDDAFAKTLGQFNSLEELKTNIREGMTQEKKSHAKEDLRTAQLDALVDDIDVTMPAPVVAAEKEKMFTEFSQQLKMSGTDMDAYLGQIGKSREGLLEEWSLQAEKRVKSALILEKLAEDLAIKDDSEKIEEEMNKTLQYYKNQGEMKKDIDTEQLYRHVSAQLKNEAVFEQLAKLTK